MTGTVNAGSIIYEVDMDTAKLLAARREVDAALNGMGGSMGRLEASVNRTERSVGSMERSMSSLTGVAKGLLAALSVQQIASYADAWTVLNNKVANSIKQGETQADVMQRIFDISQATQSSMNGTATLYARLERGTRTLNTSTADLAKLTTIINQGFAVSGATAQEAESAIVQLSQGLASGVLRGEEFNSVSEQGSRLTNALADSLGVSLGQLRAMAAQGKLTNDVVVNGLLSQGDAIGKEFAKTTVSISQGLLVAGNNVTKFFGENSTVKSFSAGFRDSVITVSEHLDVLSDALIAVAAIMGGRFVGAMAIAITAQASKIKTTIQGVAATREAARQEAAAAVVTARKAAADKGAALSALNLATAEYNVAKGSAAEAFALENVIRLRAIYIQTAAGAALANNAVAASQAKVAATGVTMASAMTALRTVTAPLGGPIGIIAILAAGWYLYAQSQAEARKEAIAFADGLDRLNDTMKSMSNTQLRGTIADTNESIRAQKSEISSLEEEVATLQDRYKNISPEAESAARSVGNLETYLRTSAEVTDSLNKKSRDLANAREKLAKTEGTQAEANRLLTNNMLTSMGVHDGLIEKGTTLERVQGAVARAFGATADEVSRANQAGQNYNPKSLEISPATDDGDKMTLSLEEQNKLLKIKDERTRAVTKAEMEMAKVSKNRNQVTNAGRLAGENFDLQKAEEARKKAQQESESQDKKSASSAQTTTEKLEDLKQKSEQVAESTREMSRAQSILTAQQSLGKSATEIQKKEAGEYAAKIWDTSNALRALSVAESLLPERQENTRYQQQATDLKNALESKRITQAEYDTAAEKAAQDHQNNLSKIRSETVVNPVAQNRGQIDPIQQLANENAKKLQLMRDYQAQEQAILLQGYQSGQMTHDQFTAAKTATDAQYLALRTAQDKQFQEQQTAAQWQLLSQQGLGYDILTSSIDAFAGNASNALTGLMTGSMSAQDAMRSLGNTILNSAVNSVVQLGVEMLKNFILSQTLGVATQTANAAAATAGGAAALAAWTPAAIAASIATAGAASGTGLAAYTSAQATGSAMSLVGLGGGRKNGGAVSAGGVYPVGEGNLPEFLQTQHGLFMIPGDNGKVFSNKDVNGSPTIPKASTGMDRLHQANSNGDSNSNAPSGGLNVVINVTNNASAQVQHAQSYDQKTNTLTIDEFITDMREKGPMHRSITQNTSATTRLGG